MTHSRLIPRWTFPAVLGLALIPLPSPGQARENLYSALKKRPEYRLFTRAIRQSGLHRRKSLFRRGTLFAPTNRAFRSLHGPEFQAFFASPFELRSSIRYHLLRRPYARDAFQTDSYRTRNGNSLFVQVSPHPGTVRVDGHRIFGRDLSFHRCRIHRLDGVLLPEPPDERTLFGLIRSRPEFSIFADLLSQSGMNGLLRQDLTDYTVFAPTNAAFLELEAAYPDLTPLDIRQIVTDHLVRGRFESGDIVNGGRLRSVSLRLLHTYSFGPLIEVENARVLTRLSDVEATNGILHTIDTVILVD